MMIMCDLCGGFQKLVWCGFSRCKELTGSFYHGWHWMLWVMLFSLVICVTTTLCFRWKMRKAYVSFSCSCESWQGRGKPCCGHWWLEEEEEQTRSTPTDPQVNLTTQPTYCLFQRMLFFTVCFQISCPIGCKVTLVAFVYLFCSAHWWWCPDELAQPPR